MVRMDNWIDLRKIIPDLSRGSCLHVVNVHPDALVNLLTENGFSVFTINGSEITDKESFFLHVKNVFNFPAHFGKNWDAWTDCLGDFERSLTSETAIIWKDADKSFLSESQTFIQAVNDLYNTVMHASLNYYQVELFIVGSSPGFKNVLKLDSIK